MKIPPPPETKTEPASTTNFSILTQGTKIHLSVHINLKKLFSYFNFFFWLTNGFHNKQEKSDMLVGEISSL